jgi:anthranilate/para-aminobenzoate synthase component I
MALLRELEVAPRGPYAGAVGYLDASGACDLSVVIRTALLPPSGGIASVHTGGGIVYDSEPHSEWEEAEDKARALLEAIADTSAAASTPNDREAG